MLDRYLTELRQELARRLPEEYLQVRLAEAESHLREGIEARVELGLSREEAEREVIAAFGETQTIARLTPPARSNPALRLALLLAGYGFGLAFFLFAPSYMDRYPRTMEALLGAWIALGLAFVVVSFRSRRSAPIPLLGGGLVAAVVVWVIVGSTWLDLHPYGGMGLVPPGEATTTRHRWEGTLRNKRADLALLNSGLHAIKGPQGIKAFREAGGYRAPAEKELFSWDSRLAMMRYPDARSAIRAWEHARTHNGFGEVIADASATLAAMRQAQAAGLGANLIAIAPSVLASHVGAAVLLTLLDAICASLGAFVLRRRGNGGRSLA